MPRKQAVEPATPGRVPVITYTGATPLLVGDGPVIRPGEVTDAVPEAFARSRPDFTVQYLDEAPSPTAEPEPAPHETDGA